ncbi:MAG: DUF6314 family protein [Pseudomonadota bacterium]
MRKPEDLKDFEGAWTLMRRIEDRQQGQVSTLAGSATFANDGFGLTYREEGALSVDGQPPLSASRTYLWRRGEGLSVKVLFEDGSAFHAISLGRTMPEATHICAPDLYYVTYDFNRWPSWSSDWRVRGPKKDYRMRSDYVRPR